MTDCSTSSTPVGALYEHLGAFIHGASKNPELSASTRDVTISSASHERFQPRHGMRDTEDVLLNELITSTTFPSAPHLNHHCRRYPTGPFRRDDTAFDEAWRTAKLGATPADVQTSEDTLLHDVWQDIQTEDDYSEDFSPEAYTAMYLRDRLAAPRGVSDSHNEYMSAAWEAPFISAPAPFPVANMDDRGCDFVAEFMTQELADASDIHAVEATFWDTMKTVDGARGSRWDWSAVYRTSADEAIADGDPSEAETKRISRNEGIALKGRARLALLFGHISGESSGGSGSGSGNGSSGADDNRGTSLKFDKAHRSDSTVP
ncbi:hypothetical protein BC832DRAFT_564187 [Gaertneriomyces semiglobifer]|nr:hypothetical protein BC832DRAFT_564187 [Gaertneriomyces semiglobifer]